MTLNNARRFLEDSNAVGSSPDDGEEEEEDGQDDIRQYILSELKKSS